MAIRASDETQALFHELAKQEEFKNKGDFLNRLLVLYQTEITKEDVSMLKPAIETVETLTTRLFEVLNGTAAAITTKEEKHSQELDEQKKSFEETRTLLQRQITSLEEDRLHNEERIQLFIQDKETAESKTDELLQQTKQLENTINDKTALIEEYKTKNDNLSGVISEYKAAAAENKNLSDTVNSMKQVNNEQQRQIDELKRELQQQADTFKIEQENLKKSFLIDKDTALLELKKEQQKDLQEQQTEYSHKINEYEATVRSLLEQIQDNKTAPKTASGTSRKKAPASKKTTADAEQTEPTTTTE